MKFLIIFFALSVCCSTYAQTQIPDVVIPITLSFDNPPYPAHPYDSLQIGLDSIATDSLDFQLGEYNLPPIPPPGFPAFLILPYNNFSGEIIVYKDFRFGELPYTGVKEYRVRFCSNCGATINWVLPLGATGLLQDLFGGVVVNVPMSDSGSYYVSDFAIFILRIFIFYDNVVPVELNLFTAEVMQSDRAVLLNWSTSTETNNMGFELERTRLRSSNYAEENWEKIGIVDGNGTTTEPKSYSFLDVDVAKGKYKYRLKQIDFDGTFNYSNEIEVEVDFTPKEFVLYQNYPNPFNPVTTIKYDIPDVGIGLAKSNVTIKVYDILGNEVATLVNEYKNAGSYEVEFNVGQESIPALASGIYLYQLVSGEFSAIKKLVLLK